MKNFFFYSIMLSSVLLMNCSKEKNTNGNVNYQLTATDRTSTVSRVNNSGMTLKTQGGSIVWTGGTAIVSEIKFEAKGSTNIEYKSNVPQTIDLFNPLSNIGGIVVPPGTYEKVEFKLSFASSTASALELRGNFTNSANVTTPIVIRFNGSVEFKFEKKTPTTIDANGNYNVLNSLMLNYMVTGVTEALLNAATKDATGTIVISATSNTNLFNLVNNAKESVLKVEIK